MPPPDSFSTCECLGFVDRTMGISTMSEKKDSSPEKASRLDLRYKSSDDLHDPNAKRFDFFLIDTGWNHEVFEGGPFPSQAADERRNQGSNLHTLARTIIRSHEAVPQLIGHDPIILVYDHYAHPDRKTRGYRGFRLNLGLIKKPDQALARLQEFLRFVAINRDATHLQTAVRRELYREGLDGLIKILRETSTELI